MAENNTRAGQPGEDNRERNQARPETSVQGRQPNDPRSRQESQGRGSQESPGGVIDTEDRRNAGKASADLQDDDQDGTRPDMDDSNQDSKRTNPGVNKGNAASKGPACGSVPGSNPSNKR